tara:strand:+ start:13348 stop:14247 length:900 start_codon:yes stop_codon:yes gene_type:complete
VYRINDDLALISTVDFFPPIVDDPYAFGQISVSNALSDIYAMGGMPVTALNIVGFPSELSGDILATILKGASDKAQEAGLLIVGGHTVNDNEPKYGLAVTGVVKPGDQITNAGAKIGDRLVLTKPIGTGLITTAGKNDLVDEEKLSSAIDVMSELNLAASIAMSKIGVNACSDVTGFGLLGHLRTMLESSGVGARLQCNDVPLMDGVWELAQNGAVSGGTYRNIEYMESTVLWPQNIDGNWPIILNDAQTSGGLLISVSQDKVERLITELVSAEAIAFSVIGEIVERDSSTENLIAIEM